MSSMSGNHDRENGDSIELTSVTGTDAGANGSFAAQQQRAQALIGEASATHKSSTPDGQAETPADVEAVATGHSTSAVEAQQELSRLLAAASRQNATNTTTRAREDADAQNEYQAFSVRTNMLRNYWDGYHALSKFRRWILVLRLLIALAQVVSGIVVLALPTSLGDSFSFPETCDPEGMFVYLVLHISRVACSVPIDLYLGLSPHRSPRARRRGADGLAERERNRRVGSLRLDRKLGRLGDLLGFCHVVLFIVGNYVVWTSVECSHAPADSKPLFFTCVAMLSISYLIILEVALMVFVSTTSAKCNFLLAKHTSSYIAVGHLLPPTSYSSAKRTGTVPSTSAARHTSRNGQNQAGRHREVFASRLLYTTSGRPSRWPFATEDGRDH